MPFAFWDYVVMGLYVAVMAVVAVIAKRRGQDSLEDFFTGGKNLPWWLVGISMVATTFAADTPLAVTGIIASEGIAGNWIWWNFMFSGLFTVFLYAKLWKRADVITDVEFIELRYGGKPASILRGFRALYLAFPINCIILGWVTVGMAKVLTIITGADQWLVIVVLYLLIGIYIAISGLWGVVVTDFLQFIIAMGGSILLAWLAVNHVGGLDQLHAKIVAEYGVDSWVLQFNPITSPKIMLATALVWVGMMWWASWYPGSEPGGGGYIAQRMFSARDEKHAVGGTLLFNVAHFALRPWPWILVALVSLIVYPNLADPETGYPKMMLDLLPTGLLGLLVVAFLSAFVSTVSTHLNWGASYVVNDFYKRYLKPPEQFATEQQAQQHYVWISRLATLLMMVLAVIVSYFFDTVKGGWEAILSIGAGTGLVFMLRWFWWRINAWSEITAMIAAAAGSFLAPAIGYEGFADKMIFTTIFATFWWVGITLLTPPESDRTLQQFFDRVLPGGPGWKKYQPEGETVESLWPAILQVALSAAAIIGFLYGTGEIFFGSPLLGVGLMAVGVLILYFIVRNLTKIRTVVSDTE
ncbi:MAG: sodium:solute symporter family protein [Balneolaceae bacterium]|nr:sodium:solute symporter family protein [Balneolaceae bacterium]